MRYELSKIIKYNILKNHCSFTFKNFCLKFSGKREKKYFFYPQKYDCNYPERGFFFFVIKLFKVKFTQKCLRAGFKSDLKSDINPIWKVFFPAKGSSLIVFDMPSPFLEYICICNTIWKSYCKKMGWQIFFSTTVDLI